MSQFDFGTINPDTKNGTELASDLNAFRDALNSLHRGNIRPSYAVAGMHWIDDTNSPWLVKVFDGASTDTTIATYNPTTQVYTPVLVDAQVTNSKLNSDVFSTDRTWTGSQRGTVVTDNDGSFDMNAGQNFLCTPTAGFTLTFTNITAGQSGMISLVNPSAYTVAKAAAVKCNASMLASISAAGTYKLEYWSPDGTTVQVTASGALS